MAGQRGRDILLKVANAAGAFDTLAGIRTSRFQFNSGLVDSTALDSPDAWRELLAGAGVKTLKVKGAGVFKDAASDARMREIFFAGEIADWQLIIPDFGMLRAPLQISELSWSGEYNGVAEFSISLESAGMVQFTPDGGAS